MNFLLWGRKEVVIHELLEECTCDNGLHLTVEQVSVLQQLQTHGEVRGLGASRAG